MLKFIQYSILFILVCNGSYPLLVESGLITPIEIEDDCQLVQDHDTEGESSSDDLAAPDKHVFKEPKPNDLTENEDLSACIGTTKITNDLRTRFSQVELESASPKISIDILRHIYFSKSDIYSSAS